MCWGMLNCMPWACEPSAILSSLGFWAVALAFFIAVLTFTLCAKPVIATAIASDTNKTFFMVILF